MLERPFVVHSSFQQLLLPGNSKNPIMKPTPSSQDDEASRRAEGSSSEKVQSAGQRSNRGIKAGSPGTPQSSLYATFGKCFVASLLLVSAGLAYLDGHQSSAQDASLSYRVISSGRSESRRRLSMVGDCPLAVVSTQEEMKL